jgi:hypothetical protein
MKSSIFGPPQPHGLGRFRTWPTKVFQVLGSRPMTRATKGYEIVVRVGATIAPRYEVMDGKPFGAATILTRKVIPLQNTSPSRKPRFWFSPSNGRTSLRAIGSSLVPLVREVLPANQARSGSALFAPDSAPRVKARLHDLPALSAGEFPGLTRVPLGIEPKSPTRKGAEVLSFCARQEFSSAPIAGFHGMNVSTFLATMP